MKIIACTVMTFWLLFGIAFFAKMSKLEFQDNCLVQSTVFPSSEVCRYLRKGDRDCHPSSQVIQLYADHKVYLCLMHLTEKKGVL